MFVVLVLFCLVNSVGGLAVDAQNSVIKELKGKTASLTWTIIKSSGETILNGGINFVRPGNANSVAVAFIGPNNAVTVVSTYSDRGWTVSLTSQNLVLSANNLKEEDDATYTLNLFHQTGGKIESKSKAIRLKVLVPPHYPTGSFTEGKETYDEGQQVTLKCEPDGSPKPIKIFWKKNSVFYKETDTPDSNLVFQNVSRIDTGKYTCEAVNDAGTANKIPTTDLVIKYRPVNTKFNVTSVLVDGKPGTLKCTAEADPKAQYTIGGESLSEQTSFSQEYRITKVQLKVNDKKKVTCRPFNRVGTGRTVQLILDVKVQPRILKALPRTMDAIEGKNFSIKCSAAAKPPANIVWLKNGSPLPNSPPSYIVGTLNDNTFKSEATLTLDPVKRQDNGIYTCNTENLYGRATSAVTLNLKYLPEVTNKDDFKKREIREGLHVEVNCIAVGNPQTTYYIWRWENGTVIQNKTSGKLLFPSIKPNEGGRLSCAGHSPLGEGEKQYIDLFVQVPPHIIIPPKRRIFLNESDRLLLFCNASGVPEPTIQWSRDEILLRNTGDLLSIGYVKYSDAGTYTCTASNGIEPNDTAMSVVTIYFRPVIVTNSASYTMKGAESGAAVQLVCKAEALPLANLTWLYYGSRETVNETDKDVIEITKLENTILMRVKARIGAKYLCYANNNRGNATQLYEIRPKGTPEAPVLDVVRTYILPTYDDLATVQAYVKWTPGYDGGRRVWYKISYGIRAEGFQNSGEITAKCNCYTITKGLQADKDYLFFVLAHNNAGPSNNSNTIHVRTEAFYGKASVERFDEGKIVRVSFVVNEKANATRASIRYRETQKTAWEYRTVTSTELSRGFYVIEDLDPEKIYEFQVVWYVGEKEQITDAGKVGVWGLTPTAGERSGLTRTEIIAIIAGIGGFLLIVILILFLCLVRRRQKPKRDEAVVVMRRQPATSTADIVTRRSLIGSVEDDPFVSAHYGSEEKKKSKARDSYYLPGSEDLNTFSTDNTARHSINPAENSQAYQPYRFGKEAKYQNQDDHSSSEDDTSPYNTGKQKPLPSDEELSSEPGYARAEDVLGNGQREPAYSNPNDVYSQVNKGIRNRPMTNGRGAPPPYRPRSAADPAGAPRSFPPYHRDDQLDLDDPEAVPFDDPLPPPMPVLPNSRSVPDDMWDSHYPDNPRDDDSSLERHKSSSRNSLPGKPYINAKGKLVRPGSSGGLSSSNENFNDDERRSPEPEVPSGRSRHMNLDSEESSLVSYLV